MADRLMLDERPRCEAQGILPAGGPIPCDLHRGHPGRHEWAMPLMGPTFTWPRKGSKQARADRG